MAKKKEPKVVEVNVQKEEVLKLFSGCSLTFNWFGVLRSVDDEENEAAALAIEADARAVHTSVCIIDTKLPEYAALGKIRTAAQAWYDYNTLPYVVRGQRLFRRDRRQELWEGIEERKQVLTDAAKALNAKRGQILEWGKKNLGKAFDERLYPDDFGKKFNVQIREHSIDPPSYLAHTNAEEYKRTLQLTLADIGQSMQRFEAQCMQQVGVSVRTLTSQLGGDSPVRQTTIDGLMKVLNRVGQMKFEGTQIFKSAMDEARDIIDGVDVSDLRKPGGTREETKKKLQELLGRYQQLKEASVKKAVTE